MYGQHTGQLPVDDAILSQLAWRLGIRVDSSGDGEKFKTQLDEALSVNRKMINHLMVDVPLVPGTGNGELEAIETELILDPNPDAKLVTETLVRHGLTDPLLAMDDLRQLSTESVSFLSPRRCRHFFAALAPELLAGIAQTPNPHQTLRTMVQVTESLGAKASLWELLRAHKPTMQLMVKLCASAPYLSGILTNNPGMIDELIDSLLMNRLPSADRLDAQSIELCRGAAEIELILHGFKNSAHLMIGVRDMLGKESIEATQAAISDTAEAVLRRVIDDELEKLAERFGDPVDDEGQPAELLALALGKFGGREPNYHSDLDMIFLYSAGRRNEATSRWAEVNYDEPPVL